MSNYSHRDDVPASENPYASPQSDLVEPVQKTPFVLKSSAGRKTRSPQQWQAHIRIRVRRGDPRHAIVREAVEGGLSEQVARQMIDKQVRAMHRATLTILLIGAGMVTVGTLVTFVSYMEAASSGGVYLIWWGPVLCGIFVLLWGFARAIRTGLRE